MIFAAVIAEVPPTDAVNQNHYDKWNARNDASVVVNFVGPYSEALQAQFGGMPVREWFNFPQVLLRTKGRDLPWIAVAHGGLDQVVEYGEHARPFFFGP